MVVYRVLLCAVLGVSSVLGERNAYKQDTGSDRGLPGLGGGPQVRKDSPTLDTRFTGNTLDRSRWQRYHGYDRAYKRAEKAVNIEKHLQARDYRQKVQQRDNEERPVIANDAACEGGRRITCKLGTVMSPGYPDGYYSNQTCSWQIIAEPGKVIEVDFVDFSLSEPEGACPDGDHVTLIDVGSGYGETPPVDLCARDQLPKFSTVGNEVRVNFVTDGEGEERGFLFNFLTRDPIVCEDTIELMGESGTLTSQNYPGNYLPHSDCRWRIVTPENTVVSLDFSEVALEHARSCQWDGVTIYDGPTRQSPSLGVFCGHRPSQNIRSIGHVVLVVLMSDGSGEDRGFSLDWQAMPQQ